ncbi:MetQ/NlpA family ABC transporter substrate-binding protein [Magnetospirillum molischianum]|uniref:Lipoprotein n=1 Tax=Magnetospirillum molischianum DSM 120 TaxID=1150626 RepID=H8FPE3_MAGML|nr:MetQ/NlpA family ABC transporter substrate-binding protein [Magnetospirillum molischianum]CCG40231.1 D-methionine ABC transporter protein, periplasmic binding protein [Magnetospirillum molischianum DSM 120]
MVTMENKWLRNLALTTGLVAALVTATAQAAEKVKLGVIGGAEEEIAEVAKKVAATKGLDVELVTFSDYVQPNAALNAGDLDANAFQHKPYLDAQIKAHGYQIVPIGFTIVEPIGLYSKKVKKLEQLPTGAKIGIPNDPSNGARALRLLAANGLIAFKDDKQDSPSLLDITKNPKKIKFYELEAPQLPRALDDFDAAVINTNYSLNGGFDPIKDALLQEPRKNNPYGNFIAVREQDKDKPVFKTLVASYQSKEVSDFLDQRFKGAILPAW